MMTAGIHSIARIFSKPSAAFHFGIAPFSKKAGKREPLSNEWKPRKQYDNMKLL